VFLQGRLERLELIFATQFAINPRGVRNVVSVLTTVPALQEGRRVDIRDSEPGEIVHSVRCAAKRKMPVELQPVASEGNPRGRHKVSKPALSQPFHTRRSARGASPARRGSLFPLPVAIPGTIPVRLNQWRIYGILLCA
jgi:hypothetical protein